MKPESKNALAHERKATFWDDPDKYQAQSMLMSPMERRVVGAFYGALLGSLYALVAGTIDAILFRDLPMRVDWPAVGLSVLASGAGGLALGVIVAWPNETLKGVAAGALAIAASGVIKAFIAPAADVAVIAIILLYTFLPFAALSLPISIALRLIINRYEHNLQKEGAQRRTAQGILLAGTIALAVFAGSWSQMPPASVEAVRKVNRLMQTTLSAPADKMLPVAVRGIEDFRSRAGESYVMAQRKSLVTADGIDVQVNFDNGFVVTCLVDNQTLAVLCEEGGALFGPFQFDPGDQR
ncbi:MAG: hypothetical protein AAB217_23275 [Chloroflexota bacterium]